MALTWVDFVWSMRKFLRDNSDDFNANLPQSTPPSGNYTITNNDYVLNSSNATAVTWTMPSSPQSGQVLKVKVKGNGEVTLSGSTFFTDASVTSLTLVKGDMVTLRWDGSHWNVGD